MKPYYDHAGITIYQGHILIVLPQLPAESIQCVVTSPPYWGLRDYGLPPQIWDDPGGCEHSWGDEQKATQSGGGLAKGGNQTGGDKNYQLGERSQGQFCQKCNTWRGSLGLEPNPELYIQHIVQIFREVWRVGRKDMTVFLNLGDSYNSGSGGYDDKYTSKSSTISQGKSLKKAILSTNKYRDKNLKPKDLCGIPWRVALALQADGWWLRSDIIWSKPNPMPESVTDRPTRSHEYVFLLTKSGTSQFWTHRDKSGTRTKPKADYRWVNQITKEEVSIAPPDWKEKVICPNCEGKGRALIDLSYECLGLWTEYWKEDECPVCEGKKKVQKWKRINLWQGHDYFYDADAVREPHQSNALERTLNPRHKYGTAPDSFGRGDTAHQGMGAHPAGRNLRSVWTIATEPTPEAHFATFPEKLVIPCIKAGTSEKGCCPECGAPWVRVVEKKGTATRPGKESKYVDENGQDLRGDNSGHLKQRVIVESKTIGWKPSCVCGNSETIPCTVLDPFSGSGKALIVAQRFGRKGIGIELNPEYCKMPLKKIAQNRLF